MFYEQKICIYKGIIQYLLDSTNYSLHRIANLSNSPVAHLQLIYHHNKLPQMKDVELNLLKILFIDMEIKGEWKGKAFYSAEVI